MAKPLPEREHLCLECGYRTDRDQAAAEMVLCRGLELIKYDTMHLLLVTESQS